MKGHSRHNSSLIGRKNQEKFENYRVSVKIGIESKSLNQSQWSWHHSLQSAEDALFNNINKYNTFNSQGAETPLFSILGGHPVYEFKLHTCKIIASVYNGWDGTTRRDCHIRVTRSHLLESQNEPNWTHNYELAYSIERVKLFKQNDNE